MNTMRTDPKSTSSRKVAFASFVGTAISKKKASEEAYNCKYNKECKELSNKQMNQVTQTYKANRHHTDYHMYEHIHLEHTSFWLHLFANLNPVALEKMSQVN